MCVHFYWLRYLFRPVVACKERQNFIYKENRTEQKRSYVPFLYSNSSKYVNNNHRMLQQCPYLNRLCCLFFLNRLTARQQQEFVENGSIKELA